MAWSNIAGAQVTVSEFHSVGSDHLPLLISFPSPPPPPTPSFAKDPGPGIKDFFSLPPAFPLHSADDIDAEAARMLLAAALQQPTRLLLLVHTQPATLCPGGERS